MASPSAPGPAKPAWADSEAALAACLILGAVLAAYSPALAGGLLWDDDAHVTKLALRSLHGLWRIWFEAGATQQYYPLLHTAFWVEHGLWGDAVLGYHLANAVEHAAAAWLLYLILRQLSFPVPRLAALIFALHPVCVESVAWISEQKNTLSAVFYMASALAYLRFDATRRRSFYSWALAFFVLALLTKTVTATLPAALLVLLWWKRGGISWKGDVLPLVPWFALAAASGLFTAWAEAKFIGAEGADFSFSFLQRLLLAARVAVFYAAHLAWPRNLMFIYPRWDLSAGGLWPWLCLFGIGAAFAAAWWRSRVQRGPLAALMFFVGTLFPALGFINVYPFRFSFVADHFQYLASLGLILPASWAIAVLVRASGLGTAARAALLLALPAVLGVLSWRQARVYRDAQTLYRSAIAANPDAWLMHYNLAVTLGMGPAHLGEAISEYRATVRLKPDHWEAHNNLASALLKQPGGYAEAVSEYMEALRYNHDYAEAENNLGVALRDEPGRRGEAEAHLRAAIRIRPDYDAAHSNLGVLLLHKQGSTAEAVTEFQEAARLAPAMADYHYNLANALAREPGREDDAIAEYHAAIGLKPGYAEAHSNLAVVLARKPGHADEAITECRESLRLDPGSAQIHRNLANMLAKIPERRAEAAREYMASLRIDPNDPEAHLGLGLLLAGARGHIADAIGEFEFAVRLSPDFAEAHYALGASYAAVGRKRADAERELERALELRPDFDAALKALEHLRAQEH